MFRGMRSSLFLIILFTFVVGPTDSIKKSYIELLSDERIELIFQQLTPKKFLQNFEAWEVIELSSECNRDLKTYIKSIAKRELWALKLLDASSREPTGILEGNIIDLGNFDECTEVQWHDIQGHHCSYEVDPKINNYTFPYRPTLSLCLPSACGKNDVMALINATITSSGVKANVATVTCTDTSINWWNKDFVIWAILFNAWIIFLIMCTGCHIATWQEPSKSKTIQTLVKFSVLKSAMKVLDIESNKDNMPVINGLRVLSTASIVLTHAYFIQFFAVNSNLMYITKWFRSWNSVLPLLTTFAVDTFFTMSGFLMAYAFFKQMHAQKKFNLIFHYVHRYIRLTPPMALCMYSGIILAPKLVITPRLQWINDIFITGVDKYWWSSLLYIQNFIEPYDYRVLHFWSLCVDMQMFWISPLIIYPMFKKPKFGLLITGFLIFGMLIVTALIVGINRYRAVFATSEPNMKIVQEAFAAFYTTTYTRASPYLFGILLAYVINKNKIKLNQTCFTIGWIAVAAVFFGYLLIFKIGVALNEYNIFFEVIAAVFLRPVWSLITCWIIFAGHYNPKGMITRFLSWKYFLPLSKVCYSVYIVHIIIPVLRVGTLVPSIFSDTVILHNYAVDLPLSFLLGFLVSIIFEIPFFVLEEVIFRKKNRFSKSEKEESRPSIAAPTK